MISQAHLNVWSLQGTSEVVRGKFPQLISALEVIGAKALDEFYDFVKVLLSMMAFHTFLEEFCLVFMSFYHRNYAVLSFIFLQCSQNRYFTNIWLNICNGKLCCVSLYIKCIPYFCFDISCLQNDPDKANMPKDGTVHELTSNVSITKLEPTISLHTSLNILMQNSLLYLILYHFMMMLLALYLRS